MKLPSRKIVFHLQISRLNHQFHALRLLSGKASIDQLPRVSTKMTTDQSQFSGSFLQTNFLGYYECSACHVLAPDLESLLQHECAAYKSFFAGARFPRKMLHEQL